MKHIRSIFQLIAAVTMLGVASTAHAAGLKDYPAPAATPAARINWTGPYLAIMGGYAWESRDGDIAKRVQGEDDTAFPIPLATSETDLDGLTGRLALGYDQQMGKWVFGARAYYGSRTGADDVKLFNTDGTPVDTDGGVVARQEAGDYYGANIRIGHVFGKQDRGLFYGTLGWQHRDYTLSGLASDFGLVKTEGDASGVTLGAGFEYAVTQHIFVGAEYEFAVGDKINWTGPEVTDDLDARDDGSAHSVLVGLRVKM